MSGERSLKEVVGEELLLSLQNSYMKYLESSAAIYEANGAYAISCYMSPWCDFLNRASRRLAGDVPEEEALLSGKWIYHEDCRAAARKAMKEQRRRNGSWTPVSTRQTAYTD